MTRIALMGTGRIGTHHARTIAEEIEGLDLVLLADPLAPQLESLAAELRDVPCGANNTYRRMPLVSIHEMMDVIAILCGEIARVTAPILIVHGERDHTADPKSADYLYDSVRSARREKFILPDAGHLLPLDMGIRERVFARTTEFLCENAEQ